MNSYRFLTTWLLAAPRPDVWAVLEDPLSWPSWWQGVIDVAELATGGGRRVGSSYHVKWRSRIPYPVEFTFTVDETQAPELMIGRAEGDLVGRGCWRLFEERGVTAVVYDWQVATTKRWMNLLAPIARTAFERNHDTVMRWGGEGLARQLGTRLLAAG